MIQENRGSGSELKRKWELAAGLIGVGGEGEGRLAVNRCDVKWPLIYPWNARGAIAGSAMLGNYFTARYGGVAAARVRSAVAYSKRRPREFKPGNSQGSTCAWAGITGARRAGEKRR